MTAATGNTRRSTLRILIGSGFFQVRRILPAVAVAAFGGVVAIPPPAAAQPLTNPSYTREQAARGKTAYPVECATCHGANLDDGEFAPPLKGIAFRQRWGRRSVEAIFTYIGTKMPPARPGSLGDATSAALVAYLLQENALQPGANELPADPVALRAMLFPSSSPNAGNGLTAGVTLPPPPGRTNPLDKITPVTDAMLARVPDGDWLTWRRGP
jgi:mono/diheme cytochrome c family protein